MTTPTCDTCLHRDGPVCGGPGPLLGAEVHPQGTCPDWQAA